MSKEIKNACERQKKVLIFHPALAPYRIDLFNALAERCDLRIVFLQANLLNQKFDQDRLRRKLSASYGYLSTGIKLMKRTICYGVWSEIDTFNPDVVVTSEFTLTTLSVAAKKAISSSYSHVLWSDDNLKSVIPDILIRRVVRRMMLQCIDGLLLLSEESAELYRTRYGATLQMGIIPILRDEAKFRKGLALAQGKALSALEMHKIDGKRIVLYVGRLSQEKRLDRLIDAFDNVHRHVPDAVLVLVGDGAESRDLKIRTEAKRVKDRVVFAGRSEGDELKAWYLIGSMFALTSSYEPFGAVVNEALLAGMPVVCSDRAGARVLIENGVNGVVVNAGDKSALEDALIHWLMREKPVSASEIANLRPSLMRTSFKEVVDGYVGLFERVAP